VVHEEWRDWRVASDTLTDNDSTLRDSHGNLISSIITIGRAHQLASRTRWQLRVISATGNRRNSMKAPSASADSENRGYVDSNARLYDSSVEIQLINRPGFKKVLK